MIKSNSKRGMISPYQLFFILVLSRVAVVLSYYRSIALGELSSDIFISLFLAMVLSLLFSLLAYYCVKENKSPCENGLLSAFYLPLFIFLAAQNINSFSYFSSSRVRPEKSMLFVTVLIIAAVCYAAALGIEAIGRFSLFCAGALVLVSAVAIASNLKNAEIINFFPLVKNGADKIVFNAFAFASNSPEPFIFLFLGNKVNGNNAKPLFLSVVFSFGLISALAAICLSVLGSAGSLYSYPAYAFYQMASIGNFTRLDVVHTAFWVFAMFFKSSVLIYCASLSVKKYSHISKCVAFSVIAFALATVLNALVLKTDLSENEMYAFMALYGAFGVVIPVISLVKGRCKKCEKSLL